MTEAEIDIDHLRSWIGKQERASDSLTKELGRRYAATLSDCTKVTTEHVPLGIHWCLAPAAAAHHELGIDGHTARGGFLPLVPLPRRMWAASKINFMGAPKLDTTIERLSTVTDVALKRSAKSGPLVFVTVDHHYSQQNKHLREPLLQEQQTIVYREHTSYQAPKPEFSDVTPTLTVLPDSRLLFRYSALTFNAHRIHYDHGYATFVEGYPGLVVHGPLMASILMNMVQASQPHKALQQFVFRALAPAFVDQQLQIATSRPDDGSLQILNHQQAPIMTASAQFAHDNEH